MRVDPTGPSPIVPSAAGSAPRTAAKSSDASEPATESSSFAPSAGLAALLASVRQAPEVRTDAVAAASAKLAAGTLNTPQAAADAAKGFIESGDANPSH